MTEMHVKSLEKYFCLGHSCAIQNMLYALDVNCIKKQPHLFLIENVFTQYKLYHILIVQDTVCMMTKKNKNYKKKDRNKNGTIG